MIEGSTRLLQHLGDALAAKVFEEHRRLLRDAFTTGGGYELQDQGDGFLFAFQRAHEAVLTAVAAQRLITKHSWPDGAELRVRMGLHTGEPVPITEGYVGVDVHRAARICAAGHGGQILLSQTTRDLIERGLSADARVRDLGAHRLKDLKQPERLFQLFHSDLLAEFPPLKSLDALPNNLPTQLTSFIGRYQAASWKTARRVVAKVEFHVEELFPRVGFIVTNLETDSRAVVRFYNKRGTAEQWIKEGKQAVKMTRLSCSQRGQQGGQGRRSV